MKIVFCLILFLTFNSKSAEFTISVGGKGNFKDIINYPLNY